MGKTVAHLIRQYVMEKLFVNSIKFTAFVLWEKGVAYLIWLNYCMCAIDKFAVHMIRIAPRVLWERWLLI